MPVLREAGDHSRSGVVVYENRRLSTELLVDFRKVCWSAE